MHLNLLYSRNFWCVRSFVSSNLTENAEYFKKYDRCILPSKHHFVKTRTIVAIFTLKWNVRTKVFKQMLLCF